MWGKREGGRACDPEGHPRFGVVPFTGSTAREEQLKRKGQVGKVKARFGNEN